MSLHVPLHATVLSRFSRADTFPSNSHPVDLSHAYPSRLRVASVPKSSSQTTYDFLPLPALSAPSRTHLRTNPTLAFLEVLRHHISVAFRAARAGVSNIASYQAFWLGSYFILNLVLTLYNKILLVSFPYPYTLTAVHAIFGLVGGTCLRLQNVYQPKSLWGSDYVLLLAFSFLYSINIAVSNASLDLVTVPFHQVVRATTPFFTTVLSWQLINARFNRYQLSSMFLVILGVCLATYGDYYFTAWGLILTLFGTVLAALKTLATHEIQTASIVARPIKAHPRLYCLRTPFGVATISLAPLPRFRRHHLRLHPLDLLTRLSRLAVAQCVIYAYFFGEIDYVRQWFSRSNAVEQIILLSGNGIIACALNIVSFEANRRSGALAMGVAANVKQALTVICAVWFFRLTITPLNALGIALTLLGGGWYTVAECNTKYSSVRN
ncbi:triose-phosphate transporter family-domain-containing protein [Lactarius psammicola]|nr:triose-phosphate transporter family-domain-containing protein [Lactarius psammicola]